MRIAISGTHNTGKSTLIAAFLAKAPHYHHEPEAYEVLGDDVALTADEGPDAEGLETLLDYTLAVLATHGPGAQVIYERSPVDYLAYAAATRAIPAAERRAFLGEQVPRIRETLGHLDLIVHLPLPSPRHIPPRPEEDEAFRRRVDDALHRALFDDVYDLFSQPGAPRVEELSPTPDRQLADLLRLVATSDG